MFICLPSGGGAICFLSIPPSCISPPTFRSDSLLFLFSSFAHFSPLLLSHYFLSRISSFPSVPVFFLSLCPIHSLSPHSYSVSSSEYALKAFSGFPTFAWPSCLPLIAAILNSTPSPVLFFHCQAMLFICYGCGWRGCKFPDLRTMCWYDWAFLKGNCSSGLSHSRIE